ncbi:hypothetical protein OG423_05760 [Micromonospora zamorensis]|uniref:hypothetical protein n=1 Tax=Micromonospora zamorensis TaxID=709883 RepID=UPI00352A8269|nr:hypothetical protein OG423_05760 [Micromonospora zamorensis]
MDRHLLLALPRGAPPPTVLRIRPAVSRIRPRLGCLVDGGTVELVGQPRHVLRPPARFRVDAHTALGQPFGDDLLSLAEQPERTGRSVVARTALEAIALAERGDGAPLACGPALTGPQVAALTAQADPAAGIAVVVDEDGSADGRRSAGQHPFLLGRGGDRAGYGLGSVGVAGGGHRGLPCPTCRNPTAVSGPPDRQSSPH